jgi:hypothetical protein
MINPLGRSAGKVAVLMSNSSGLLLPEFETKENVDKQSNLNFFLGQILFQIKGSPGSSPLFAPAHIF